jgi:hypothetical protein
MFFATPLSFEQMEKLGFEMASDCPADIDGNGFVDVDDLFAVLGDWGPCDGCAADIDGNGFVDVDDLFAVLGDWGPCP